MGQVKIITPRLFLRPAQPADAQDFHEIFSNEDVMRYEGRPPHTELSQTVHWLDQMIESSANGCLEFAVGILLEDNEYGKIIGKCGCWGKDINPEMEIGFFLNRTYWGQGYAQEAIQGFLEYFWALEETRMVIALTADVDPRNEGSLKVLKKFGFKKTGYEARTYETLHMGWCDSVYLRLDRPPME